jgi:hypothetical protein
MQRNAGYYTPRQLHVLQRAFHCTALLATALAAAVLVALAASTAIGLSAMKSAHLARLTVVYKNELHPSISELQARALKGSDKGEVSSDERIEFKRQGQWI